MLELKDVKKRYGYGDSAVDALKGISLKFRKSEFVSVLGQSGCGKTTLLNIVGGLDQYTSGDLIINGISTKEYADSDWDTYRNHSIGFIFQSYNLIPHQTVLSNVELALTLNGIPKDQRRKKAIAALEKVGLSDQIHKRPNQLSGGQMQRVAIACALINDPDILLADEPTGALDSETSVQVMELLKEIAKNRLVIMVTHNPELAEAYSTRIIKLFDGELVDDSNPYTEEVDSSTVEKAKENRKKKKKSSMSFLTALSLSFNNLMTKKGRTFLTSFAGSIGIIGIALILAVSTGVEAYITSIEQSTMSSYPLIIQESTMDSTSMLASFMSQNQKDEEQDPNKIYSNDVMTSMIKAMTSGITSNNLTKFKEFIESDGRLHEHSNEIKFSYSANLNTYSIIDQNGIKTYKKNIGGIYDLMAEIGMPGYSEDADVPSMSSMGSISDTGWTQLIGDSEYIASQYDIVDGRFPEASNEVVLIVNNDNQVSDYILYVLGIRDITEIRDYLRVVMENQLLPEGEKKELPALESSNYTYDELYAHTFKVLLDSDYYQVENGLIRESTEEELNKALEGAMELKIVGIVKPSETSVSSASIGTVGYTSALMPDLIKKVNNSDVVKLQLENKDTDMFSGQKFEYTLDDVPMLRAAIAANPQYAPMLQYFEGMTDEQFLEFFNKQSTSTYAGNLAKLGYVDFNKPSSIAIYPKDFAAKDAINDIISEYNAAQVQKDKITYTDTVALLMDSVTIILNAISYVLIAFVAISLIVSSIMIGIITYISVLERTKEIGILRAIGASKRDIARVFNAETLFVGFCAGVIGIGVSLIFIVIINIILHALTGIPNLNAVLPWTGALILVAISMFLTFVAGLIPSKKASNKDPVVALRTE